jgi:pyruvate/2-oxoglutarate/acetoin dehydrogenase E1 component
MKYVEVLRNAIEKIMNEDDRVVFIGEDIVDPYGGAFKVSKGLSTKFPERVLSTPISEAAITGIGIGLALRGFKPLVEIMFGDFVTLAADQIINSAAKFSEMFNNKVNVPLVIRIPSGGYRGYGPTHSQSLETIFLSTPGLTIISPSLYFSPGTLLEKAFNLDKTVLFVEHKILYSQNMLNSEEAISKTEIQICELTESCTSLVGYCLEEKAELVIISYGYAASLAVEAASRLLLENEILVEVNVVSILKPFLLKSLKSSINKCRRVLIVEEGHLSHGWGAEISARIGEEFFGELDAPIRRVAAKETIIPSSKLQEIKVLPSVDDIVTVAKELCFFGKNRYGK